MSETIQKLQHALSQAQTFASDTPLEALARAQLVVREAEAALASAPALAIDLGGGERADLEELLARAEARVRQYEALVASWDKGVRVRAELFHSHEVERLQRPIASKI